MDAPSGIHRPTPLYPPGKTNGFVFSSDVFSYAVVETALSYIPKAMQPTIPDKCNFYSQDSQDTIVPKILQAAARTGTMATLELYRNNSGLFNQTVCAEAAGGGHLHTLQWLRDHGGVWDLKTCEQAAKGGHKEILNWLLGTDAPFNWSLVCRNAALRGHFGIVFWAVKDYKVPVEEMWYKIAANLGLVEALSHLWPLTEKKPNELHVCALSWGHVHVLAWLKQQNYPMNWEDCVLDCYNPSAVFQQWETIQEALEKRSVLSKIFCFQLGKHKPEPLHDWIIKGKFPLDNEYCQGLAEKGALEQLKIALAPRLNHTTKAFRCLLITAAARGGHIALLHWFSTLRWRIQDWEQSEIFGFINAALTVQPKAMSLLQWAFKHGLGSEYSFFVALSAAGRGQIEPLAWVCKTHKPTLDDQVTESAAFGGHWEVLKWLRERNCPWGEKTAQHLAYDHFPALVWAIKNGCHWGTLKTAHLIEKGHFATSCWATMNGCPKGNEIKLRELLKIGSLPILQMLYCQGTPSDFTQIARTALSVNQLDIARWAIQAGGTLTSKEIQHCNPHWVAKYFPPEESLQNQHGIAVTVEAEAALNRLSVGLSNELGAGKGAHE